MISEAVRRNTAILSLFAVATAGVLAFTHEGTRSQIACNRQQALQASLREVMPAQRHGNVLRRDYIRVDDARLGGEKQRIYRARKDGEPAGAVMEVTAPDGYGGPIDLLVGVNQAGTITGVRVVPPHNETPGLGDKIETDKSDWIYSFNGKSLTHPDANGWAVQKDGGEFDSFTGATITPRAVVNAVHQALRFYRDRQSELHARPATSGETTEPCDE
jgi:electron transport complex protein RnfG